MAVASTLTKLPLDRFAAIAGIHPLHMNGIAANTLAPSTVCGDVYCQHSWQRADSTSRESIAETLGQVEAEVEDYLNFDVCPTWHAGEDLLTYPQPANPELFKAWGRNVRGLWETILLPKKLYIVGGAQLNTLMQAGAHITTTDSDNDGYAETSTVVVNVPPTTLPGDLHVFYPGESGDPAWEIRPVKATVLNGVATIVFKTELTVDPAHWDAYSIEIIDPLEPNGAFVTTVDVYTIKNDPSQQVEFRWEVLSPDYLDPPTTRIVAQYVTQPGAMLAINRRFSQVTIQPGNWDSSNLIYTPAPFSQYRVPDMLRVWYQAGYKPSPVGLDPQMERMLTYLTLSRLARPLCSCDQMREYTEYWSDDLSMNSTSAGNSRVMQTSRRKLDNPLGTKRAEIWAWDVIRRLRVTA